MPNTTHKMTVRLPEPAAQCVNEFCTGNGMSFSAWVEAVVEIFGPTIAKPVEKWTPKERRATPGLVQCILRAREIDSARRSRRVTRDGSDT